MPLTAQLKTIGNYVSRIHYAIDQDKPLAAKRFTRQFSRFIIGHTNSNLDIWNSTSGLDRYTQLGCYPLFYMDQESSVLCPDCATSALSDYTCPAFRPVVADINYEDANLICNACDERIQSAYAEPEDEDTDENGIPNDPTEPEESDITTSDHKHFYQDGKLWLTVTEESTETVQCTECNKIDQDDQDWCDEHTGKRGISMSDQVKAKMESDQFWPNVWFISDHGNAHLMSLDD